MEILLFNLIAASIAFLAGIVAAVSGFGIGSLVTPLLCMAYDIRIAIALVAIPHALATALRFSLIYKNLDRTLFIRFGLASAAGGLFGAWIHSFLEGRWLGLTLGILMIIAGATGFSKKSWRLKGPAAIIGGILSGVFGGLVGNQGGIRAAALLNFDLRRDVFVAVSTASALIIDAARLPVYLWAEGHSIAAEWRLVLLLCAAVIAGTVTGMKVLKKIDDAYFKKVISGLLLALGGLMLFRSILF